MTKKSFAFFGLRVAAIALSVSAGASAVCAADVYPSKSVKIVVPYAPGGAVDQVTRRVAQKLTEQTGQSFYVDNKPGGTSTIGVSLVARSAADGYSLVANDLTYSILPHVFHKLAWDYEKDLIAVAAFNFAPVAIAVAADSKFRTLSELVAYAKANPGKLNYGTGGAGTMPHFGTEALKKAAGFDATHVPFKGNGEATMAVLSKQIDFQLASTAGVIGQVKGGKLRLLAVTGNARLKALPDVPTFAEAGVKNYGVVNFTGLWLPKGTPPAIVTKLQNDISIAMASKEIKDFADSIGAVPDVVTGEGFSKLLRENSLLWGQVAESAKIDRQ